MNYIHRLKFEDKQQADTVIQSVSEQCVTVVELGIITKPAILDEYGNVITTEQVLEGYHFDVLAYQEIDELKPYIVQVDTPEHGTGWAEPIYQVVSK